MINKQPRKKQSPTVNTTRYSTPCPHCCGQLQPGQSSKVYANKWYHLGCWDVKWKKVLEDKKMVASLKLAANNVVSNIDDLKKALQSTITDAKLDGSAKKTIQLLQQELDKLIELSNQMKANK